MSQQLAQVHATPGVAAYMAEVEAGPRARSCGAARACAGGGGRGAVRRRQAAAAAALLPHRRRRAVGRGRRRRRDGAHGDARARRPRRRRAAPPRAAGRLVGLRCRGAAKAAGDYLFACAFAVLAETGDARAVGTLADAALCLARGEAMQKLQVHEPADADRGLPRTLRAEDGQADRGGVPARLGGRSGARCLRRRARARVPDRRRHPRLCGADAGDREDPRHRPARRARRRCRSSMRRSRTRSFARRLAGGPLDGALVRVAATDALARSRQAALDYAAGARSSLGSHAHREELEALTYAVVDRAG